MAFAGALMMVCAMAARDQHRGGWRVDEAYKLSETYALHHLLRGDVHHADWFRSRVDRTNPPFGKYVFGLALLIAGKPLPEASSLTRVDSPLGEVEPMFSRAESAPFLPLLVPARWVSLLATSLTLGLIIYLAARIHGTLAALIAAALFVPHWITEAFGATAIFDPLLTLLVTATAPLLWAIWQAPERALILAPLLGVLPAMAFQTRLNGGIAFAGCIVVLASVTALRRCSRTFFAGIVVTVVFVVASIVINPYYWASSPPDPTIPADVRKPRPLASRVVHRFERQVDELGAILARFRAGGVRMPLWAAESSARTRVPWDAVAKARFLARALGADPGGALLLAGVLAGVARALSSREKGAVFLLVWCGTIAGGTCLWLPIPWPRYLVVVLPPLALLGGLGWASVMVAVHAHTIRRRVRPGAG